MLTIPNEVKRLFIDETARKNFRVRVVDGSFRDIINSDIVSESVSFTESINSGSSLKFGLCESSTLSFDTVGIPNLKGKTLEARIEIDSSSLGSEWCNENASTSDDVPFPFYSVSYGTFTVESCDRDESNMELRKFKCYSAQGINDTDALPRTFADFAGVTWRASDNLTLSGADFLRLQFPTYKERQLTYTEMPTTSDTYTYTAGVVGQRQTAVLTVDSLYFASDQSKNHNDNVLMTYKVDSSVREFNALIESVVALVPEDFTTISNRKQARAALKTKTVGFNTNYLFRNSSSQTKRDTVTPLEIIADGAPHTFLYKDARYYSSPNYYYQPAIDTSAGQYGYNEKPIKIPVHAVLRDGGGNVLMEIGSTSTKGYYSQQTLSSGDFSFASVSTVFTDIRNISGGTVKRTDFSYRTAIEEFMNNNNMRSVAGGSFELAGEFGVFGRDGDVRGVRIDSSEPLEIINRSMYASAWWSDDLSEPFSAIRCNYTNESNEKTEALYQMNESGTVYDISNNAIIKSRAKWSNADIQAHIEELGNAIAGVQYMPCTVNAIGMPWLEAGDCVAVETADGYFDTVIMKQTIKGVQHLSTLIESK